jgi:hypothetical protein
VEPEVPRPDDTQLGRTIKGNFDQAVSAGAQILSEEDFKDLYAKLKDTAQKKGFSLE